MDQEESIRSKFEGPDGFVVRSRKQRDGARQGLLKVIAQDEIPHPGDLAEAAQEYRLYRMVEIRHQEGRTWTEALQVTRDNIWRELQRSQEDSDPWTRAHAWSQNRAYWRFMNATETLLWQQEGEEDGK